VGERESIVLALRFVDDAKAAEADDHLRSSSSSISGNQTRWASPEAMISVHLSAPAAKNPFRERRFPSLPIVHRPDRAARPRL
jgi:hypothetical protein